MLEHLKKFVYLVLISLAFPFLAEANITSVSSPVSGGSYPSNTKITVSGAGSSDGSCMLAAFKYSIDGGALVQVTPTTGNSLSVSYTSGTQYSFSFLIGPIVAGTHSLALAEVQSCPIPGGSGQMTVVSPYSTAISFTSIDGKINPFASGQTVFTSVPISASAVAYTMPSGGGMCSGGAGWFSYAPAMRPSLDGSYLSIIFPITVNTAYPFSINPSLGTHTISLALVWFNPNCSPAIGGGSTVATYNFSVILPLGTVNVSSNIASSWTITGPTTITGSGTSQSYPSQPAGTYTITWGSVSGYTAPATQSLTLASGGTITFTGTYTALTCGNGAVNYPACTVNAGGSCINGTANPPTCNTCAPGFTFFNNFCYACMNGAVNYPTCTTNASGLCINGANNPPVCSICPAGQLFDISGKCVAATGTCSTNADCTTPGQICNTATTPHVCVNKPKTFFWQF